MDPIQLTRCGLAVGALFATVSCQSGGGAPLRSIGADAQAYPTGVITTARASFAT